MNRIKEVAKRNNIDLKEIAAKLNITYQALNSNMRTLKLSRLIEIADVIGCEPVELIECGTGFAHFYDPETGEWLGIRKK